MTYTVKSNFKWTVITFAVSLLVGLIMGFITSKLEFEERIIELIITFIKGIAVLTILGALFHIQHYYLFMATDDSIVIKHFIMGTKKIELDTLNSIKIRHRRNQVGYEPYILFFFKDKTTKKKYMWEAKKEDIMQLLTYLETKNIKIEVENK